MATRCRLCSANDREAVIGEVAEAIWESRRHGTLDDWPWAEAGGYWRTIMLQMARTAVDAMAHDHPAT